MLSINEIKTLRSYQQKKFRDRDGVFIAETPKVVETLIAAGVEVVDIYAVGEAQLQAVSPGERSQGSSEEWSQRSSLSMARSRQSDGHVIEISEKELSRISSLACPNTVFAVFKTPSRSLNISDATNGISLVLDDIRDPGNMGTILRLADWFGIDRVIASESSADVFQPKCVQASMGSVGNVPVFYENLPAILQKLPSEFSVYGTFMDGENIYEKTFERENVWFVIGNEAHGISAEVSAFIKNRVSIPSFESTSGRSTVAESINAAMATSVICSELKRPR
jgi:TrmH family RNA methyltransferase